MWYACVFAYRDLKWIFFLASRSDTNLYFLFVCKISKFVNNVGISSHLHATRENYVDHQEVDKTLIISFVSKLHMNVRHFTATLKVGSGTDRLVRCAY